MLTHIRLGPAVIPSYPFLILIGLWAGMWLAAKEADRLSIEGDHIYNIGLYGLLAGLVGGRMAYVLLHWDAYANNLIQALALTANAISVPFAIIFALTTALIYAGRHKLPFPVLADALAPGAVLMLIIAGIGAFLGSQTLGAVTTMPWGLTLFGQARHPAHLYQVVANAIILAIIWRVRLNPRWPGFTFLLFMALYSGSRLLLDPFFALFSTLDFGLRPVQVASLVVLILILVIMMSIDLVHSSKPSQAEA